MTMKKVAMYSLMAGAVMAFVPLSTASAAGEMKKVVHDTNAHVVKNTFGNCVITKWDAAMSECEGADNLAIYFGFDSAVLTAEAYAKLDGIVDAIKNNGTVDIIGFADAIGTNNYNYTLSERRAAAVEQYLSSRGVNTANVTVRGFGEDAPMSDCSGVRGEELKACLWRDRRVEIKLNHN